MNTRRLFDIPYYQQERFPQAMALVDKVAGEWKGISTQTYIDKATAMSKVLIRDGVLPGDAIALISNNRSEWNICDMAIQQVGAVSVPVYPTIDKSAYTYIFNDARVRLCIVSDQVLADKVNAIKDDIPTLRAVYSFDNCEGTTDWSYFQEEIDSEKLDDELEKRKKAVDEQDVVTLIYTSGTTGKPKGVMLSHANILSNVKSCQPRLPVDQTAKALSFLPVCHIYERMLLYLYQYSGISIYFAESLDTIGDNLREVQPHIFTAVPRLLEKVFDKIMDRGQQLSGVKRGLFSWSVALAERYDVKGMSVGYRLQLGIARALVFKKWQQALGGNVSAVVCGSAALQPRLLRIFLAAGIPIMEGYGLTETSPVIAVNYDKDRKMNIGTTGTVIDGTEVTIAEDGEILVRGPGVMVGYHNQPEQTRSTIDEQGWLHTGDIGMFVDGEYLKITDRKKEIFKTSGGKYITPQVMENRFKESRFIEQIMIIGENKKMPAALVVPNSEFIKHWGKRKQVDVGERYADIIQHPEVRKRIEREIERYNEDFGKWERIKKFEFAPIPWTVEGDELTPTMKLKRRVILEKCKEQVDRIYQG